MGMTIDEIIKYLPAPMCDSTVIDSEKQKEYEAHDMAVIIMRKYQKIQEIVEQWACCGNPSDSMIAISEVLEDGNDD